MSDPERPRKGEEKKAKRRRLANEGANAQEQNLAKFMEQIREALKGASELELDLQKAQIALEATAGNMQLAAQFYWDDYLASKAAMAAAAAALPPNPMLQQPPPADAALAAAAALPEANLLMSQNDSNNNNAAVAAAVASVSAANNGMGALSPAAARKAVRRKLDRIFRAADSQQHQQQQQQQQQQAALDSPPSAARALRAADNNLLEDVPPNIAAQAPPVDPHIESASVSDDEACGPAIRRLIGQHPCKRNPTTHRRLLIEQAVAAVANEVLPPCDSHDKQDEESQNEVDLRDETDYISDSEWLDGQEEGSLTSLLEVLWGVGLTTSATVADEPAGANQQPNNEPEERNVVADEEVEAVPNVQPMAGIPYVWLNASFALSPCGTGLHIKPPPIEEIGFFTWRQRDSAQGSSASQIPPPHYCKSVSAIVSIVTALLYTGVSIQGNELSTFSGRKPFADLTLEERKQEFLPRLTDALSSLLFVAAMSSKERKQRALQKAMKAFDDEESANVDPKILMMKRRLRLIPTCSWEDDPPNPRLPEYPAYWRMTPLTSLTNIKDIRLFVSSNIRSFTSRGGVALLLENILRIHGKRVIGRLLHSTKPSEEPAEHVSQCCLIKCTCEERQRSHYEKNPVPAAVRNDPNKFRDTTPQGVDCVTVELLSLLCTGTFHSSWDGWSSNKLQFGFLGTPSDPIPSELTRPKQPVWVIRGYRCFTMLRLVDTMDANPQEVAERDSPGIVLNVEHWNPWYDSNQKVNFRLTTSLQEWQSPGDTKPVQTVKSGDVIGSKPPAVKSFAPVSNPAQDEIERVQCHPDDQRDYKENLRLWRYDMEGRSVQKLSAGLVGGSSSGDKENLWVPYYKLTSRQKLVVEAKFGPKIKSILWSRWPGSTTSSFVPSTCDDPIV
eukprot:Nitzschia sp. Nitz4//scaffold22_size323478//165136//167832//NITZ4_000541-RA/size323478-processed-gene-0.405-mRNA-1//1//CDS//3329543037//6126//frame0